MPLYDFSCGCGRVTESREGIGVTAIPCPCGRIAARVSVYRDQGVIFSGGGFTKSVMPPPGVESQQEYFKEVRKRGWTGDRAVEEMRKNIIEDPKTGRRSVNTAAMTKEA